MSLSMIKLFNNILLNHPHICRFGMWSAQYSELHLRLCEEFDVVNCASLKETHKKILSLNISDQWNRSVTWTANGHILSWSVISHLFSIHGSFDQICGWSVHSGILEYTRENFPKPTSHFHGFFFFFFFFLGWGRWLVWGGISISFPFVKALSLLFFFFFFFFFFFVFFFFIFFLFFFFILFIMKIFYFHYMKKKKKKQ